MGVVGRFIPCAQRHVLFEEPNRTGKDRAKKGTAASWERRPLALVDAERTNGNDNGSEMGNY